MFTWLGWFTLRAYEIGVHALVHTTTLSNIHASFIFLYVYLHKLFPFLV